MTSRDLVPPSALPGRARTLAEKFRPNAVREPLEPGRPCRSQQQHGARFATQSVISEAASPFSWRSMGLLMCRIVGQR
jgi:hypothetical protein